MGFVGTIDAVVAGLTAGGVRAAADPADLNPPAVMVTPGAVLAPTKLCGTGRLRVVLELVARDSGDRAALEQIDALYAAVAPLTSGQRTSDPATFTRVQSTSDPTGLPALRFTIETPITD